MATGEPLRLDEDEIELIKRFHQKLFVPYSKSNPNSFGNGVEVPIREMILNTALDGNCILSKVILHRRMILAEKIISYLKVRKIESQSVLDWTLNWLAVDKLHEGWKERLPLFELLLNAGANPLFSGKSMSALRISLRRNRHHVLNLIMSRKYDMNVSAQLQFIHECSFENHLILLFEQVKGHLSPEVAAEMLLKSIRKGYAKMPELLLPYVPFEIIFGYDQDSIFYQSIVHCYASLPHERFVKWDNFLRLAKYGQQNGFKMKISQVPSKGILSHQLFPDAIWAQLIMHNIADWREIQKTYRSSVVESLVKELGALGYPFHKDGQVWFQCVSDRPLCCVLISNGCLHDQRPQLTKDALIDAWVSWSKYPVDSESPMYVHKPSSIVLDPSILPYDVIREIISYLDDFKSILSLYSSCKYFREAFMKSDYFWEIAHKNCFRTPLDQQFMEAWTQKSSSYNKERFLQQTRTNSNWKSGKYTRIKVPDQGYVEAIGESFVVVKCLHKCQLRRLPDMQLIRTFHHTSTTKRIYMDQKYIAVHYTYGGYLHIYDITGESATATVDTKAFVTDFKTLVYGLWKTENAQVIDIETQEALFSKKYSGYYGTVELGKQQENLNLVFVSSSDSVSVFDIRTGSRTPFLTQRHSDRITPVICFGNYFGIPSHRMYNLYDLRTNSCVLELTDCHQVTMNYSRVVESNAKGAVVVWDQNNWIWDTAFTHDDNQSGLHLSSSSYLGYGNIIYDFGSRL